MTPASLSTRTSNTRVGVLVANRERDGAAVLLWQALQAKGSAAKVDEHLHDPGGVNERRVGHTLAIEIGPDEATRPRHAVEERTRRERSIIVVAQDDRRSLDGRDDEIEIAVRIDVGGPDAVEWCSQQRRRQFARGGDVREVAGRLLSHQAEAGRARERDIHQKTVVKVGEGDRAGP